jgi:uncharacterized membrane protein (UPF0127 family)
MKLLRVVNSARNSELGSRVAVADTWLSRLRGMLGRPALSPGEGLFLTPCRSVHMYGMRFPLDVVFLDAAGIVVAAYRSLAPASRSGWHRNAVHALELPAGTLERTGTAVDDVLGWQLTVRSAAESSRRTEAML